MSSVVNAHDTSSQVRNFLHALSRVTKFDSIRTILEIGSRDGLVAVALKEAIPRAHVYTFECNPQAIELMKQNLRGCADVMLVEKAVADRTGVIDFFPIDPARTITPHADGNIGASSLYRANPDYPHEQYVQNHITVPSTTISDWAEASGVPKIDLIWMDVQGAALPALVGFGSLLSAVTAIYTELEYRPMYQGQQLAPAVRQFLQQHGLSFYKGFNRSEWFGDELFVRNELIPWHRKLGLKVGLFRPPTIGI